MSLLLGNSLIGCFFATHTSPGSIFLKKFQRFERFKKLLPHFNGATIYKKPFIPDSEALHLDACLTGMGAIWHNRLYSATVPAIPGFVLTTVYLEMLNILSGIEALGFNMATLTSENSL